MNILSSARFDQMSDNATVYGEPVTPDTALVFIGGEGDGLTTGTPRNYDPFEKRKEWLSKVGLDIEYSDYMSRAKEGLTAESGDDSLPVDHTHNFNEVWPPDYRGRIHDSKIAEHVADAMKPSWETAMTHEELANANRRAILLGKGVLEMMDGAGKGHLIGPFLTRSNHAFEEYQAGYNYEVAHKAGVDALMNVLDEPL